MASSSNSRSDPPSPFPSRSPLPIMSLRSKIVEKIQENRVTLIVGDTGCGKSSQVPQFLLEENMEPILCTQPRRFAVVSVARMVAKARNCEIGGEVGYHIGHSNVTDLTTRSTITFKTAGVLLEQMRDKGFSALKYKVILLDEVHERSVESDLVLACVKQFMMRNKDLRVVLMSATADIARYRDYFKDLGRGERVEVIAIPSSSQQSNFQRKVLYLEQVAELLGISSEFLSTRYCSGPAPSSADADVKPEVHTLIHKLVLHIHEHEPDIGKSILIFLPTYYSLEQQWILLRPLYSLFKVHVLHSSIDTDQALLAMKIWKSHRKVILATNIAESSVTIPGVAFVIDSCRSLQVFWDPNRKNDSSELVWVSKSQADQRKGRTGRTCDGQIYRLVTRTFYNKFDDHEYPAILRLSLRQQVLTICCAESKAINDPKVLLQKVLDPPLTEVVEDALSFLVHIHALEKTLSHMGRYEPTFYGRLLDNLPMSLDAALLTLKFGKINLLREGILIGVLLDFQPLPILQPFGQQILFTKYLDSYFEGESSTTGLTGKKEILLMGNLCAFQFWQRVFKDKHRLEELKQIVKDDEPKVSQSLIPELEEEWCLFHNLVQRSLHNVSDIYEDVLNTIHRFRPDFLATNGLPSYYEPYTFKHTCLLQPELEGDMDAPTLDDESLNATTERRKCVALPFVTSKDFQATAVAETLKMIIKEMRAQCSEDSSYYPGEILNNIVSQTMDVALCKFFTIGSCNKGNQCRFSHSLPAKRPVCKFFLTLQGCRNGETCSFSHDHVPDISSITALGACLEEDAVSSAYTFLQLLPATADGRVLILNDKDLNFSSNLSHHYDATKIIATTSHTSSFKSDAPSSCVKILWNVSHPCDLILETKGNVPIPWRKVQSVLWLAEFEGNDGDDVQQRHIQKFFKFLATRILAETLNGVRVVVIMNNIRFVQLQVERLGRECFFFLSQSFPFDESSFGKVSESSGPMRPMQVSVPISYVFVMLPPSRIQFGDYAATLRKNLYNQ